MDGKIAKVSYYLETTLDLFEDWLRDATRRVGYSEGGPRRVVPRVRTAPPTPGANPDIYRVLVIELLRVDSNRFVSLEPVPPGIVFELRQLGRTIKVRPTIEMPGYEDFLEQLIILLEEDYAEANREPIKPATGKEGRGPILTGAVVAEEPQGLSKDKLEKVAVALLRHLDVDERVRLKSQNPESYETSDNIAHVMRMLSQLLPSEQDVAWAFFIEEMKWTDVEKKTGIRTERARKIFTRIYVSVSKLPDRKTPVAYP
jgi:hypothetical protein